MSFVKVIIIFVLAGIFEIGGGYLIWIWLKQDKPFWYGLLGGVALVLYGIVATFQPNDFARTYAAYGGVFIIMSLIWAYKFDNFKPDRFDIIGAIIVFVGISIIFFAKRQ
ncbi:small multidrug resistance family-3 protein [Arcicella rosea]|uniref:YnfA family protein n=1 Tax=Arcicella rosea TaxID=502909 RepID=UPI00345DA182